MSEDIDRHVLRRYEISQKLGRGAYGIVWKAILKKTQETVALKKCFDAFTNPTDAQRTYREIMLIRELEGHPNIVRIHRVLRSQNDLDIYIVFDYMESDLHAVIRANILEDVHRRFIVYQLLCALKYMHSGRVIHRDLKPPNLLLNSECHMRLCDFGLARSIARNDHAVEAEKTLLTDYVATRWYRAPEILAGALYYTEGVDLWCVGCILGELIHGKPIFPGASTLDQLDRIVAVTGRPAKDELPKMKSEFIATLLESLPKHSNGRSLPVLLPKAKPEALELMSACLRFWADQRPSAQECIQLLYCVDFHNPRKEPECSEPIQLPLDESKKLRIDEYRNYLFHQATKKSSRRVSAWLT